MWSLTESLVELLRDTDGEIVRMTIIVLSFIILENDTLIPRPITLQLAEVLLPLFDHVRLCAPNHSHRVQPAHFVPCAFAGQHQLSPGQPMLRIFFLSYSLIARCSRCPYHSTKHWLLFHWKRKKRP